ncbi:MAG: HAMP domain-containing sensor histidine kinase [Myxococcota bacterium]
MHDHLQDPLRLAALAASGLRVPPDLAPFERLLHATRTALRASSAALVLLDAEREEIVCSVGVVAPAPAPLERSAVRAASERGAVVAWSDLSATATADPSAVAAAVAPVRSVDGWILGGLSVMQHQARTWSPDELDALDALSRLVGDAASAAHRARTHATTHDLRTPLSIVALGTEQLAARLAPEADAALMRMIGMVQRSAEQAAALLRRVDTSPYGAGPTDLSAVAGEAALDLSLSGEVGVHWDGTELPVLVPVHPSDVRRCVENLLTNAVRFARREVRVHVAIDGVSAHLVVDDDGEGLPDGAEGTVWERHRTFHRDGRSGSGLGTAIVRDVALAVGGTVGAGARPSAEHGSSSASP